MRRVPKEHPDKDVYDVLSQLASGYFMQDYDLFGETPEEVLAYARQELGPDNTSRLRQQLRRFLDTRSRLSDDQFAREYKKVFNSSVALEGWFGKTTRQWLELFYARLVGTEVGHRFDG